MPVMRGITLALQLQCCQGFLMRAVTDARARAGEMKKALRTVIERYELPVRLTANQNLILTAIDPSWKADILATLTSAGVKCAPPASAAHHVCGAHEVLVQGQG